ncbi:MAG: OBG GTPase family GTP-binding protein [Candidatus Syntropharchaeia archaeon]
MNIQEKIREIEEEIRKTPYNKATQYHIGKLKAKLAQLKEEVAVKKSKKGKGYSIKKSGDATVVLVGFPSVGKSTLLNALTGTRSRVESYEFTTIEVIPGMAEINGAKIQILDIPGILNGASSGRGRGNEIMSVVRNADLLLLIVDIFHPEQIHALKKELYNGGIRINQKPPDVVIRKKDSGGIRISKVHGLGIDEKMIVSILKEYKIYNADVLIREKMSIDRFIDSLSSNRRYIPGITVINKIDMVKSNSRLDVLPNFSSKNFGIPISAKEGINLDLLKKEIFSKLELIRIYLKPQGGKKEEKPLIVKKGATVKDVAMRIHRDFVDRFRYAYVWGESVKYDGQRVGLSHKLCDGDILTIVA